MSAPRRNRITDLSSTHDEPHVSVAQIAEYFGVKGTTVHKWIDAGLLEAFALPGGRIVRISLDGLRRFKEAHRIKPRE